MSAPDDIEDKRRELQTMLDAEKSSKDRNRMGQFATPAPLAREILTHGLRLLPRKTQIKFIDPGFGTGSFYSALRDLVPHKRIATLGRV